MFLYPALTIGFLFVAMPLLVHLINMLRHRRQPWAAMDFLLASYRKQKKWIRLRQLLLLLSRLAVAAVLIAMLCGWTGGGKMLQMLGGQTTHHVIVLDDSYSMSDQSIGADALAMMTAEEQGGDSNRASAATAYQRALRAVQDLTRRLASSDGSHQLTIMRASRAALVTRGGSQRGDAAADLSAQTITADARLINRVMATTASPVRTDLVPALDLATELINTTPADKKYLYVASDFRQRDWGSAERIGESLRGLADDVDIRMIDCAVNPAPNLAITDLTPIEDVWVAGVPVVVSVTVHNYGTTTAENVSIASRVIRYSDQMQVADPTLQFSGQPETMPAMVIDSIAPGAEVSKTFQVFIAETGTHAIEVSLPEDALPVDNVRYCTLPLSDAEKVLIVDGDPDARGAYHVASVLDPGSQVRIGAVPEVQPPSFLRSATVESLSVYRAIYLIDLPEISENVADTLSQYVTRGGGLAWFLGPEVRAESYNRTLLAQDRFLIPYPLDQPVALQRDSDTNTGDVQFADPSPLLKPLRSAGDAAFALVGIARSWAFQSTEDDLIDVADGEATDESAERPRVTTVLKRRDGLPLVTQHQLGRGRVITTLVGLDGRWCNWPGDPSFVVFLLQANATLWSGVSPPTHRFVDQPLTRSLPADQFTSDVTLIPAASQPPRIAMEIPDQWVKVDQGVISVAMDPSEMAIDSNQNVDDVLRPGVAEWVLTRTDGSGMVVPVASVIRVGEGDLNRADHADISQQLMPLEVQFLSSRSWSEENAVAGSSMLTLLLLGLLGTILAGEQALAYWASYHVRRQGNELGAAGRSTLQLGPSHGGGPR